MQQAGWNLGEEVEQRVGPDRDDRLDVQPKNEHGEQQHAAPHAAQTNEHAHREANQNFGR